jgi:hypothetical protein
MSHSIAWKFQIQAAGGPTLVASSTLSMDAYEKTQVTLSSGDTDKVVSLAANAALLIVSASAYTDSVPAHQLSYKINNAGSAIVLPSALLLISKAAVDQFAAVPLTNLSFTNGLDNDVVIDILTARDATP